MSGGASSSGLNNEEKRLDVLTLPVGNPLNYTLTIPSIVTDVAPRMRTFRRPRPDPEEDNDCLRRQIAEMRAREMVVEATLAERATAFARQERAELQALLDGMRREASASVVQAEQVAQQEELFAQNLMLEEQARIARAEKQECVMQTELASQQAVMAEVVNGREYAFAQNRAMTLQEMQVMRNDRDKIEAAAENSRRIAEEQKAEVRRLTEHSEAETSRMRQEMSEMMLK